MNTFIQIAWRNILRNRVRSLITICAIGFGLGAMIFLRGYIDGAHVQMKENFTGLLMGHIQIHAQGFEKNVNISRNIRDPESIASVLKQDPSIEVFSKRVRCFCLYGTAENSVGGMIIGIDPESEIKVSSIHKSVVRGRFIAKGEDHAIVLGQSLLENLGIDLGDKVVMMAQAYDGTLGADAFRVVGIMRTGVEDIDRSLGIVSLDALRTTLVLGNKVTDFVIRVRDFDLISLTYSELSKAFDTEKFEIMTWDQISPALKQWMDFDDAFAYIFLLIVLVVIVAGILNTILMSLLERTREFGVMMALGTKGYQLATIVGIESFLLGLIGMLAGTGFGVFVTLMFSRIGIPISAAVKEAMASFFMSDTIYPVLVTDHVLSSSLVVLISSVLISIYPAWKTSKLVPVEALRHS